MRKGTHGKNEEKFAELNYLGQARSINTQILSLERALNAHFEMGKLQGKNFNESKAKYKLRLEKTITKL